MLRDSRTDIDFNNDSNEYIYIYLFIYKSTNITNKIILSRGIFRLFPPFVARSSRIFPIRIRSQFYSWGRKIEISTREGKNTLTKRRPIDFALRLSKGVATIPHNSCPFFPSHLFHDRIFHH